MLQYCCQQWFSTTTACWTRVWNQPIIQISRIARTDSDSLVLNGTGGLSIGPIILVRSQGWEPVCSIHPNSPDLFPNCFHYDVPRLCLPCKPHNVPRAMYLAFLPDSFSSRAFLRHTLSTRRSSDHLEKVLTFCASWGPRGKKALIFIELIFICIIYLYPVLVGVANFYNKNPKSQWPDATIKAYFLLITKPKMQRTGRDWRKRQTTPDWWAASLINKGIFLPDLSWAAVRWVSFCTHLLPLRNLDTGLNRVHHIYYPESLNTTFLS